MGKVAKVAVPLALMAIPGVNAVAAGGTFLSGYGIAAGAGAAGAPLALTPLGGVGAGLGGFSAATGAQAAALTGGSLFTSANIGLGLSGLSTFSSLMSGQAASQGAAFEIAQMEENRKLARIEGLQAEAQVRKDAKRIAAAARAKGAAMGLDVSNSRSFLTFLDEQDKIAQDDILNIQIKGGIGAARSQLAIAGKKSGARSARTASLLEGGRSLLSGAQSFQQTRGA